MSHEGRKKEKEPAAATAATSKLEGTPYLGHADTPYLGHAETLPASDMRTLPRTCGHVNITSDMRTLPLVVPVLLLVLVLALVLLALVVVGG